jgi:hypothetical protein
MKEPLTLKEFVDRSYRFGCTLKVTTIGVEGPRGLEKWQYLKRGHDRIGVLPNIGDDEVLTSTQLRSLVADLNLPALEFGFEFG